MSAPPFGPKPLDSLAGMRAFDPLTQMRSMLGKQPWDSITDFAMHKSFCGKRLYPRQLTLLKVIYLETENMTAYDIDVIEEWREGFKRHKDVAGIQPDVWDRIDYLKSHGYHHFPHVLSVMGRRASKGIIGSILGAERLAYFYSLDDWQQHFGLDPGSVGELMVVATSQQQAARRQFADIRRTVEKCEYLKRAIVSNRYTEFDIRTPADVRVIQEMQTAGVALDREYATLHVSASSSVSTSSRGGAGFFNCYDEMAHMLMGSGSTKSGEEIYGAYQPSLDQFGVDKMTYIASSPYTKIGVFYDLYKQGRVSMDEYNAREGKLEQLVDAAVDGDLDAETEMIDAVAEPEMLVVQLPSWEMYIDWDRSTTIPILPNKRHCFTTWKRPVQVPPFGDGAENKAMARLRQRNPEKFKVERGGQFASVVDAYLDENMVDRMFAPVRWLAPLEPQDRGKVTFSYRAHGDPGRTNSNFGFAIAHLVDAPCDGCGWEGPAEEHRRCPEGGNVWPHVIIDKLKAWKPQDYEEHTIDYVAVGEEIDSYLASYMTMKKLSFDQWNSAGFISSLKKKYGGRTRVVETTFTERQNQERFERFKSALNLGWVHSYRDDFFEDGQCLLELELKFLAEKNGKVIKQEFGPVTTKDLADAVMVVTTDLLHAALDRHYAVNRAAIGSTNTAGLRSGSEFERMVSAGLMSSQQADRMRGGARGQLDDNRRERASQRRAGGMNPARGRDLSTLTKAARNPFKRWLGG